MNQDQIGVIFRVDHSVVQRTMKRMGLPTRPKWYAMAGKSGEDHPNWKDTNVGYKGAHYRVSQIRGRPRKCEECGSTTARIYHWASLTKNYLDVNDYKRLCMSCHKRFDKRDMVLKVGPSGKRRWSSAAC